MNKVIALILSLCLLCCACDGKRIQDMLFVFALGIDYKDGQYEVYAQITNFGSLAGGDTGSTANTRNLWIGKATDPVLENALYKLRASSTTMNLSHLAVFIFGPGILHEKNISVIDQIIRFRSTRLTSWLFATDEPLEEVLTIKHFVTDTPYYSIYSQPTQTYLQDSFISPIRIHRFFSQFNETDSVMLIPSLKLVKKVWKNEHKDLTQLKIAGAYAVNRLKPTQVYTLNQLKGIRWLTEDTVSTPLYLTTNNGKTISITARKPKVDIQTKLTKDNRADYHIQISVNAEIAHTDASLPYEELKHLLEKEVEKDVENTFQIGKKNNTDLLKLRYHAYQKEPKIWRQITKKPLTQDTIVVHVKGKIINTGFIKNESLTD